MLKIEHLTKSTEKKRQWRICRCIFSKGRFMDLSGIMEREKRRH